MRRSLRSLCLVSSFAAPTFAQHVVRASVDSYGQQASGNSFAASLSAEGRFVAFASLASNLVPLDTNGACDVFVRDTLLGTTRRVSVTSSGAQADGPSGVPPFAQLPTPGLLSISGDGQCIAFSSWAPNLEGHVAGESQLYVRNLVTGTTELVSATIGGSGAGGGENGVELSTDGRYAVFGTASAGVDPADPVSSGFGLYVRDLAARTTVGVARDSFRNGVHVRVRRPVISADGRFVAYERSYEQAPVPFIATVDIFVLDRDADLDGVFDELGATTIVNTTHALNHEGFYRPAISATGRYLTYMTFQTASATILRQDRDSDGNGAFDELGATSVLEFAAQTPFYGFGDFQRAPISAQGRFVAYIAAPPPPFDTTSAQLFVRDMESGLERIVSYSGTLGVPAASRPESGGIALSSDGTRAAFDTFASNLVPGDTNQSTDVFVLRTDDVDCLGASTYCIGAPNSVGLGALIGWAGSISIADDDFTLTAAGLPPNTSGLFFYGSDATQMPFGNGFLCVGAGSTGLFRAGTVQASAQGHVVHPLVLGAPPLNAGPGAITPGAAWNFQLWYRNPAGGGAGFNTTDALHAVFCP